MNSPLQQRNYTILITLVGISLLMLGVAFASVPLYRWFCQVTGFGGTPKRVVEQQQVPFVSDQTMTIRFNADVNRELAWEFWPVQKDVLVHLGETHTIQYKAHNIAHHPITGVSVFNVTPLQAGQYFHKIQCFCFTEQTLEPGQEATFDVIFLVDTALENDLDLQDLDTITLSYTFYQAESEEIYNNPVSMETMDNMKHNMSAESKQPSQTQQPSTARQAY